MSCKNCASPPLLISTHCIKGYVYLSDAELILLTSLRVWRGLKSLPVKAVELHCFQRTILFFFFFFFNQFIGSLIIAKHFSEISKPLKISKLLK